ncbi:AI-2E family transporter [Thalassoroseus pseudoceratinae]|uniref:AI-2E family transporter n=1 Tax=Thalassoroseus pseudoceratinae TaxID=2713176 RepID=UPI0014235D7F|nr:AI-2E family transporter [Thalassoroseus pseudoceratinae]
MKPFAKRVWIAAGIIAAMVVGLWLFTSLFQAILILFAGTILAVFLTQLSHRLANATSLNYQYAFALVVITFLTIMIGGGYLMGNQIVDQLSQLSEELQSASDYLLDRMENTPKLAEFIRSNGESSNIANRLFTTIQTTVSLTITAIGGFILFLFLGFYFAYQSKLYRDGVRQLFPDNFHSRYDEICDRLYNSLWKWMLGRMFSMVVITIGSTVGLYFMNIPVPITLGVIAGLLTFIPNFGPVLAAIPPMLIGLKQGVDVSVYVAIYYTGLQFVESYFLTPFVAEHQVSLPPVVTLSCQLIFGTLAGVLGVLLAEPLALATMLLIQELYLIDTLGRDPADVRT